MGHHPCLRCARRRLHYSYNTAIRETHNTALGGQNAKHQEELVRLKELFSRLYTKARRMQGQSSTGFVSPAIPSRSYSPFNRRICFYQAVHGQSRSLDSFVLFIIISILGWE